MAFLKIIGICFLIYGFAVSMIWLMQEHIAFPAPRRALPDPANAGIDNAERIAVTTSDGVELFGWYLHPDPVPESSLERAPALIWFYGNFETVGVMAPVIRSLRPPGWGVLVLDIRGYGESGGKASEDGFYLDANAAWDFLIARPEIDSSRIVVYGRSLGTALATHLGSSRPVAGVILEAPFTNGTGMARAHYSWIPPFTVRLRLDNLDRVKSIRAPLLVLHGADDTIVPLKMGRAIAEAGNATSFEVFENAGHNDYLLGDQDRFHDVWTAFLTSVAYPE